MNQLRHNPTANRSIIFPAHKATLQHLLHCYGYDQIALCLHDLAAERAREHDTGDEELLRLLSEQAKRLHAFFHPTPRHPKHADAQNA